MKWITDRYPTQDELQVKDHDGSYRVGYWEDAHERVKAWMPLPALPEGELPR